MDITTVFGTVFGGSNPSGRTSKEFASLKGSPRLPARQVGGQFVLNFRGKNELAVLHSQRRKFFNHGFNKF